MLNDPKTGPSENLDFLRTPHTEFIQQVMETTPPARFLLSSPPGGGKTHTLAALVTAMLQANRSRRILTISPSPLPSIWQGQLGSCAGREVTAITPQVYRRLQVETNRDENVWSAVNIAVVSLDFLRAANRTKELLGVDWDLIIIDEAHLCSESSQRGRVAREIWACDRVRTAIAATSTPTPLEWLLGNPNTRRVHWDYATLAGSSCIPKRSCSIVHYELSSTKRTIFEKTRALTVELPKSPQGDFLGRMLLRRLHSSMYVFEQSLRQLVDRSRYDVLTDIEQSEEDERLVEVESLCSRGAQIRPQAGLELLELLDAEREDGKWQRCARLLKEHGLGSERSGILFTDFADTAEYVDDLARAHGFLSVVISGRSSFKDRELALRQARQSVCVLICTPAAEGLRLDFTNQVFHYDFPWNPVSLMRRFGLVERVGSPFSVFEHRFLLPREDTMDGLLLGLLTELEQMEKSWGRPAPVRSGSASEIEQQQGPNRGL